MEDIFRGILGITVMIAMLYLFSSNRRAIDWKLVIIALGMQILFGLAVLKVEFVRNIFDWIGSGFVSVLEFTKQGSTFVFGGLMDPSNVGFIFAFQILPTILFFSALSSILYYLGILQRIIYALAFVMTKVMRLSGAESLAAAANVFIGQTEAPLIVKPYLDKMTKSELLCLMVGGMATIAGGVLAAYIGFLGGDDIASKEEFARHLLTASIMSAPAAILAAKILYPETEEVDTNLEIPKDKIGNNLLEAISNGTSDGLKLAVNVGAMLVVFIALVAMLNAICSSTFGDWIGWSVQDGSMALMGDTFLPNQDTLVRAIQVPMPALEEMVKVVQESVVVGTNGTDSIVFNIVEQPISTPQFDVVYDTLLRSEMDIRWAVIGQEAIAGANGVDSFAAVDGWVLYDRQSKAPLDTLAYASNEMNRISLNMHVNQLTTGRFPAFNLEYVLGVIMSPIAWILGTPSDDILIIGQLLGKKTILNEFVAYADIPAVSDHIAHKSKIIATYALCGFANFASIGIQLGGILLLLSVVLRWQNLGLRLL
ncbi:Na+ dependent nucleoside transporter [Aureispira anguillae]|uniref:Na+ dependent nucleoside transporter n=1 Tax=Aureispira anguillae TaxID=2864201 RepID=A0A916DR80_9BACT|nr:Na+ dependent nucleoside transporter [Aureispira anguillae]